jgi:hypothetical protein
MESAATTQPKKTTVKKVVKVKKTDDISSSEMNTQVNTPEPTEMKTHEDTDTKAQEKAQEKTEDNSETTVSELEINNVLEFINSASDKFSDISKFVKDHQSQFTKDERLKLEASFKKLFKAHTSAHIAYDDMMSKQVTIYEKSSNGKSNTVKKVVDKEKSAIHKLQPAHPFLLVFMKKENGSMVSRSEALSAITDYVSKNPEIVTPEDKRYFNLTGDLDPLFVGIKKIMENKKLLENDAQMPTKIKYTEIMKYMSHCFVKDNDPILV